MKKEIPWSAKYMASGHHTDRNVMTVIGYENVTGVDHPVFAIGEWHLPYQATAERLKSNIYVLFEKTSCFFFLFHTSLHGIQYFRISLFLMLAMNNV